MKDGSKGSKYVQFIYKKPKEEKLKDEPHHKLPDTKIHQKVYILEALSKTTKVTMTLNLATKVHAMAIQPYNREKMQLYSKLCLQFHLPLLMLELLLVRRWVINCHQRT